MRRPSRFNRSTYTYLETEISKRAKRLRSQRDLEEKEIIQYEKDRDHEINEIKEKWEFEKERLSKQ